jgi:hypothetical protein
MDMTWIEDADAPPPGADTVGLTADVPTELTDLPDGRSSVTYGDVDTYADFCQKQGDNAYGYQGTCGLASSADVLNQFGIQATESSVVDHAVTHGECQVSDNPEKAGGTSEPQQAEILTDLGLPSHTERGQSLEDLAGDVENGHGVIISANAGELWNDANYFEGGAANHAVTVTGVARDPETGQVQGFYINDSGTGHPAEFVDASTMTNAWLHTGGGEVVTDAVHPAPEENR